MCESVIKSHQMMIAAGHPPYAPVSTSFWSVSEDKWKHLRTPPLILRRELIENWKYTNVRLPRDRDEDELTSKELQDRKIDENQKLLQLKNANE